MRQGTSNFTWLRFDQSRLDPVREVIVPRIEFIEEISYGSSVTGVFGRGNETRRITLFEDKGQKKKSHWLPKVRLPELGRERAIEHARE